MNFRGRIAHYKPGFLSKLIFPLFLFKKYFEWLQNLFVKIIWSELIQGKKVDNQLMNLIIFLAFLIFSWIFYYLENYEAFIFIGFILIWTGDFILAKHQFISGNQNKILLTLDPNKNNEEITWRMYLPDGDKNQYTFLKTAVRSIFIARYLVKGGSFQEVVGTVWQVGLTLDNLQERVLGEDQQVIKAVKKAQSLAKYFNVPIVFESSIGRGKYAAENLNDEQLSLQFSEATILKYKQNKDRVRILSRWTLKQSWHLLGEIWQESGLLLFVLIVSNFMVNFGQFLDQYFRNNLIDISNIFNWFVPRFSWFDIFELIVAILLIVFKGWQISRRKNIVIDRNYLKYFLGRKYQGQLNTQEIQSILLLDEPNGIILIISPHQSLVIDRFHSEEESTGFLFKIVQAIESFNCR